MATKKKKPAKKVYRKGFDKMFMVVMRGAKEIRREEVPSWADAYYILEDKGVKFVEVDRGPYFYRWRVEDAGQIYYYHLEITGDIDGYTGDVDG